MNFQFEFSVPIDSQMSEFDLGNITFVGDKGERISSLGHTSKSMMLLLAISDLGDALICLRDRSKVEWVGTGSSFIVDLRRVNDEVWFERSGVTIKVKYAQALSDFLCAAKTIFNKCLYHLPSDSAAMQDLSAVISEFKRELGNL